MIWALKALTSAEAEKMSQVAMEEARPAIPSMGDLMEFKWKAGLKGNDLIDPLEKHGFADKWHGKFIEASEAVPSPMEIGALLNRGDLSDGEANDLLEKNRMGPEQRGLIKKLFKVLPGIQDMVRFAVREVFSPAIVAKFGTDEEFPEQFAREAAKQGLTEQWARAYWRAHWELPSLTMGYEMFHRGIISRDELAMLMKTQDVMPFWRDKLMALNYNVYTRVDVRRMHKEGVLDTQGVFEAFTDIGYDTNKAEKMTEFTIKLNDNENREATKGDIIGAFKKGVLTEAETRTMLKDLGYGESTSDLLVMRELFDVQRKRREARLRWIKKVFISGRISRTESMVKLAELEIVGAEANTILEDWEIEKKEKEAVVSFDQLVSMLKFGIIDRPTLFKELSDKGYDLTDTTRLVELAIWKSKERKEE